jgi:hypothetical protein
MPILVTFADSSLIKPLKRLRRQATEMNVFSKIQTTTEQSLDNDFRIKHSDKLRRDQRGFGYWIWKPQVILQELEYLEPGDFLVYMDVGCHLNARGISRLNDYFRIAQSSASGILAFDLSSQEIPVHREVQWTKSDALDFFGYLADPYVKQSAQIEATVIILHNRESSRDFFASWLKIMEENPDLSNDSPSRIPNDPEFIEHRHDQSIFSLLCKQHGVSTISFAENFPRRKTLLTRKPAWRDLSNMPIQARRDKIGRLDHWRIDVRNGILFVFKLRFVQRFVRK